MAGINFDNLTLDEVETVEELTGQTLDELMVGKVPKAKMVKALALIVKRRSDPSTTLEQVGGMTYLEVINLITDSEVTADGPKAKAVKPATSVKPAPS